MRMCYKELDVRDNYFTKLKYEKFHTWVTKSINYHNSSITKRIWKEARKMKEKDVLVAAEHDLEMTLF